MKTHKSLRVPGLVYEITRANKGGVIVVRYMEKQVIVSPQAVKVKETIQALEDLVGPYNNIMEDAYHGNEYDREKAGELRSKLYTIFSKNRKV